MIHAADLHLDSPFEGLGGAGAAMRRAEQREMLRRIFALVEETQAQLLLLAGDVFDSRDFVYAETAEQLRSALSCCPAKVFVAPGNHDPYRPSSPWATGGFEGVHIFKSGSVSRVELPEEGVCVYGAAFTDSAAPPLLRGFHAGEREDMWNIGVFHGDTRTPDSRYGPVSEADIAQSGLDYLALGHVHSRSPLSRSGGTWWAYPGCSEGRGFDETGEKGVYLVELSEEGCSARFIPTCVRRYGIAEADVSADIAAQLPQGTENDIYRLILRGECERSPDMRALHARLASRFFSLEIRDAPRPLRDIWESAEQDSLRGLFLRRMRAKYESADENERQKIIQAVRWGLAALENGEAVEQL